tara:strand:- start:8767 stop:10767 length:2001 start_codon:yes stop_codon:yes gene_type:complete
MPTTRTADPVLRQLLEATQEGFWHIDGGGLTIDVNPAMCGILGRAREDVLGRSIFDFVDETNLAIFDHQLHLRENGITGPYEIALQRPDGTNISCINNATPVLDESGARVSSIGLWTEITDIKTRQTSLERTAEAAERASDEARQQRANLESQVQARTTELLLANNALRTSQEHYRLLSDLSPDAVFVHANGKIIFANPEMVRLMEADSIDEILGLPWTTIIAPANLEQISEARQRLSAGNTRVELQDIKYQTLRGNEVDVDSSASQMTWESQDAFLVVARDISARKQLEQQLRQAQRLEAVGQLTGGIAHDVNNLLAVIQGNTEFLADEIGDDNEMVRAIQRASRRGAELTQRLLAFSRQQQLQPKSLDLSSLVDDLHQLLSRTLGERIDVRLSTNEGLWPATADPGQLENVILNLAINARDAMPDGGTLTIACRNAVIDEMSATLHTDAQVGEFAVLSVRDTGTGMSEDVKSRIFEPFFTTKEFGKGSGLGLSMAYGFVRQSGGHITIDSEPGAGTEILLYLPRAHTDADESSVANDQGLLRGQGEHILVVEDDDDVRALVAISLVDLGYRVTDLQTAEQGLALLQQDSVDLILSDVVLLGDMSGPDLLNAARAIKPDVGALLMSGYPADANRINAYPVLRKPFQRAQLAQLLRETLSAHDALD